MNFSLESGSAYIKNHIQEFFNNSRVLRDRLLVIGRLMNAAKARGDQETIGKLTILQQQTKDLFNEQLAMEQKLMPFAQYFGVNTTLGALPIALGLAAATIAGGMYIIIEKMRIQGKSLDLIAAGKMTPAEAAAATDGTVIGLGSGFALGTPIALALGAIFIWMGGLNLRNVFK